MTEQDWEEFKKNVIPIEKKITYLRKRVKKIYFKKKEDKEKFEDTIFL